MRKTYICKLTSDGGGAPCAHDAILSLAICRPAIRSAAQEGSIILGFAVNFLCNADPLYEDNCLIYMARVTKKRDGREYFSKRRYVARPDWIYRWDDPDFEWKEGSKLHSSDSLPHDLGEAPEHNRANVLLSEGVRNFRCFREKCPVRYKKEYPRLKSVVERLQQGSRVNHDADLRAELGELMHQLWEESSPYRESPAPGGSCQHTCGSGNEDCAEIEC